MDLDEYILHWIENFLANRPQAQRVVLNDHAWYLEAPTLYQLVLPLVCHKDRFLNQHSFSSIIQRFTWLSSLLNYLVCWWQPCLSGDSLI